MSQHGQTYKLTLMELFKLLCNPVNENYERVKRWINNLIEDKISIDVATAHIEENGYIKEITIYGSSKTENSWIMTADEETYGDCVIFINTTPPEFDELTEWSKRHHDN